MNTKQTFILRLGALAVALCLSFPPYAVYQRDGVKINIGYSWLFSPPDKKSVVARDLFIPDSARHAISVFRYSSIASVNVPLLLTQIFAVLSVTGLLFWSCRKGD